MTNAQDRRILDPRPADISEQDRAVADYLNGRVTCEIHYTGAQKDADGWSHDAWAVLIRRRDGRALATQYHTGTGLRRRLVKVPSEVARHPRTVLAHQWHERNPAHPVRPMIAGVIWSLMMDASGAQGTYSEFCADYGYDEDSRRALDLYLACQQSGEKLRAVFTREELDQLETLLEDY